MGKHRNKNLMDNLNLGELLRTIDVNQVISLLSTLIGANNMSVSQLSSILRNYDLDDMTNENNGNRLKSQLLALADKLDQADNGGNGNVQDELIKAIKNLQLSSDDREALRDFLNSNLENSKNASGEKEHKKDRKSKK